METASTIGTAADPAAGPVPHPADRLEAAVRARRTTACVGLDPVLERLPATVEPGAAPADRLEAFGRTVLDAVAPHVPCVKLQSACYERFGADGVRALERTLAAARGLDLVTILDVKRGDIGISSAHYAAAAAGAGADWVTVSGYLGADGIEPFLTHGEPDGRRLGVFVLVRTSNPGSDAVQTRRLDDGRTVAEAMADLVAQLGAVDLGVCGAARVGAVVAATKPADGRALRTRMPAQPLLVPGFGAQGGGLEDVRALMGEPGRALVTASRSVICVEPEGDEAWTAAVGRAAADLAESVGRLAGLR